MKRAGKKLWRNKGNIPNISFLTIKILCKIERVIVKVKSKVSPIDKPGVQLHATHGEKNHCKNM